MAIDETGTNTGLPPKEVEEKSIHLRCKRDGCDSILATEVKIAGLEGRHMYRCTKCKHTHVVMTGGTFNYF